MENRNEFDAARLPAGTLDMLRVREGQIVNEEGQPVWLRGTCIGGWMNMENFINGHPGAEHGLRDAMAAELGPARAEFFFERLLDHFLAEDDIAFIKACGATVVRLPVNYRHFERDARPFEYLEAGFTRLRRAVDWCRVHGLYAIIDLHAAPGWQNPDWHSDNDTGRALFWEHPSFQDRWVALWQALAERFCGDPAVAGYDLLNEPVTHAHDRPARTEALDAAYRRAAEAIRAIDPDHIIFLEGDDFASGLAALPAPFAENLVYSGHDYNPTGLGPGPYPGVIGGVAWDRARLRQSLSRHQAVGYARRHNVPLWMGEFGAVYNGPAAELPDRVRAMADQMSVWNELAAHWTTWTYKDLGVMGWVKVDPDSPYMETIRPVQRAKAELELDSWSSWLPPGPARRLVCDLARLIEGTLNDPNINPAENERGLGRSISAGYAANLIQPIYARCFKGMSEYEMDEVLASFALRNCRPNTGLLEAVETHLR